MQYLETGSYLSKFTYHDKNGPFKNLENRAVLLPIFSENNEGSIFSLNNILTETHGPTDNNDISDMYTKTYTYTEYGYPRTVTVTDSDGDITTYNYTYNNE